MFDIGFTELLLIGVVGLLVIGPERLPETIRTGVKWLGRARQTFSRFRSEIEDEIGMDEIKRDLRNEAILEKIEKTREEFKQATMLPGVHNESSDAKKSTPTTEKPDE